MAEHSSKSNPDLHKRAISKAMVWNDEWNLDMFRRMDPKRLSPADIDLLNDYVSLTERPY